MCVMSGSGFFIQNFFLDQMTDVDEVNSILKKYCFSLILKDLVSDSLLRVHKFIDKRSDNGNGYVHYFERCGILMQLKGYRSPTMRFDMCLRIRPKINRQFLDHTNLKKTVKMKIETYLDVKNKGKILLIEKTTNDVLRACVYRYSDEYTKVTGIKAPVICKPVEYLNQVQYLYYTDREFFYEMFMG